MTEAPQEKKISPRTKAAPARKQSVDVSQNIGKSVVSVPMPDFASGVDVSQYQQTVDWKRVAEAGYSFAFIRATQASGRTDPMFNANWVGAKQAGILRSTYHVFDPDIDPQSQAENFIKSILSLNDNGELPPVLDIEPISTKEGGPLADKAKIWLDMVESALGKKPILYSNPRTLDNSFISVDGVTPSWVWEYPLWLAYYPSSGYSPDMQPPLPRGWSNWVFWQYTDRGKVNGIQGSVDLNFFNGSVEQLRQFVSTPNLVIGKTRLNFALNDRPEGPDRLDYEKYADAFAQVLSGQYTQTPLTVGIYASWGMGKSFLLEKIREKLKAIKKQNDQLDFAFIDFNAWVYSGSENLWAGLVTTLYDGIEKHYESKGDRLVQDYRRQESLKQLWRTFRKSLMLVLVFAIPAIAISVLLDYQAIQENWKTVFDIFLLIFGGAPLLSKLPDLLKGLKALIDSVVLLRSEELAKLSSRKDFRDQVGFMADIQAELRHISDLIKELDQKKKQKTRFIIFVDDLDRCPPNKAVEVLEAIMLLLSDRNKDPFIIFLAMDARVLVKAVEMRYGEVLKGSGISGYEFLDKIVQIPFRIPPSPDTSLKKYVKSLLYQSEEAQIKAEQPKETPKIPVDVSNLEAPKRDGGSAPHPTPELVPVVAPPEEEPFTQDEKEAFETFSRFISRNPRRVKRIVNIYRMSRILVSPEVSPQVAVKWTILTEQWPFRIAWVMQMIEDDIQLGKEISMDWTLASVYENVRDYVRDPRSRHLVLLDEDAENFDSFIATEPSITVGNIHKLWSVTFNLNPAMQNEVLKSALFNGGKSGSDSNSMFVPKNMPAALPNEDDRES